MSTTRQARAEQREMIFADPITGGSNYKLAATLLAFGCSESEILGACRAASIGEFENGAQSAARLLGRKPPRPDNATLAASAVPASRHASSAPGWCRQPFSKREQAEFEEGAASARKVLSMMPQEYSK